MMMSLSSRFNSFKRQRIHSKFLSNLFRGFEGSVGDSYAAFSLSPRMIALACSARTDNRHFLAGKIDLSFQRPTAPAKSVLHPTNDPFFFYEGVYRSNFLLLHQSHLNISSHLSYAD